MGAFYYSIHVKTDDPAPVLDAVGRVAKKTKCCLVSPARAGWVSIYPEHFTEFEKTAKSISGKLDLPLLAVFLYDSDVLSSVIYQKGKVIDSYSSHPDYFQKVEPHVARKYLGSPEKYAPFLDHPKDIQKLGELFDAMRGTVLCTTDLPEQFSKLMGLTDIWTSYEYLQDFEETDGIKQWDQFIHVPALSDKIQEQKRVEALFQRELDRLQERGILKKNIELLAAKNDPKIKIHWATTIPDNLLLVYADWNHHSPVEDFQNKPLLRLSKPWMDEPTPLGIETKPHLFSIHGSPNGQTAVFMNCNPNFLEIWDIPTQSHTGTVPLPGLADAAYFLSDEEHLLTLTQNSWFLIDIAKGSIVSSGDVPAPIGGSTVVTALHPSEEWFAVGAPGEIRIVNLDTNQTRTIPFGSVTDLTSTIAPHIRDTINEVESNPDFQASIGNEWKSRFEEFANRPFVIKEYVFSIAFCNRYLCCGTNVGVRAFPWEAIITSQTDKCPPRFAYLRDDRIGTVLNESIFGMCPDPKRNRLLFGQGGKLLSMSLADGKVTTLMTLPDAARIMRIASLGNMAFALEVWVSFPHYGPNTNPSYLYIVDLKHDNDVK